jgi:hypothetical protein
MYFVPFSDILYIPRQTHIIYSFFSKYRSRLSNLVRVAKEWQVVKTFFSSTVQRRSPRLRAAKITLSILSCSSLRRLMTSSPQQASDRNSVEENGYCIRKLFRYSILATAQPAPPKPRPLQPCKFWDSNQE